MTEATLDRGADRGVAQRGIPRLRSARLVAHGPGSHRDALERIAQGSRFAIACRSSATSVSPAGTTRLPRRPRSARGVRVIDCRFALAIAVGRRTRSPRTSGTGHCARWARHSRARDPGSRPQVREHREDAAMPAVRRGDPELGEDVADVLAHRRVAHHQPRAMSPLPRPSAISPNTSDSRGVRLQSDRRRAAGSSAGRSLGIHHGAAADDAAEGVDELLDLADPFLEEIADPARTSGEQITA